MSIQNALVVVKRKKFPFSDLELDLEQEFFINSGSLSICAPGLRKTEHDKPFGIFSSEYWQFLAKTAGHWVVCKGGNIFGKTCCCQRGISKDLKRK